MTRYTAAEVLRLAQEELDFELNRKAIDAEKDRIRKEKTWRQKIFPFQIIIKRI